MRTSEQETKHEHCWHAHRGPVMMVIKDGHTVQQCCKCQATRQVHLDHAYDRSTLRYGGHYDDDHRLRQFADYSSYFAPMGRYFRWGGY